MFSSNAYFPLLLSEDGEDPTNTKIFLEKRIFRLQSLPDRERDFIVSSFVTASLQALEKKFSLSNEDVQLITRIIRRFYFKEINKQEVFVLLDKTLFSSHPSRNTLFTFISQTLLSYVIPQGFSDKTIEVENTSPKKNIIFFSLKKAVEKYPRIMNERITDNDIVFRGSDGPVIPSIRNWMTAYHQEMGLGTHKPFERSQFLFHNVNALKLSQRERNVLAEILRSLDEESELPIQPDTQSIDLFALANASAPEQSTQTLPQNMTPKPIVPEERPKLNTPNNAIPASQRSEASFYAREPIDDRKDAWHETPQAPSQPFFNFTPKPAQTTSQTPVSLPAFAKEMSFTDHAKIEEIPAPPQKTTLAPKPFSPNFQTTVPPRPFIPAESKPKETVTPPQTLTPAKKPQNVTSPSAPIQNFSTNSFRPAAPQPERPLAKNFFPNKEPSFSTQPSPVHFPDRPNNNTRPTMPSAFSNALSPKKESAPAQPSLASTQTTVQKSSPAPVAPSVTPTRKNALPSANAMRSAQPQWLAKGRLSTLQTPHPSGPAPATDYTDYYPIPQDSKKPAQPATQKPKKRMIIG